MAARTSLPAVIGNFQILGQKVNRKNRRPEIDFDLLSLVCCEMLWTGVHNMRCEQKEVQQCLPALAGNDSQILGQSVLCYDSLQFMPAQF